MTDREVLRNRNGEEIMKIHSLLVAGVFLLGVAGLTPGQGQSTQERKNAPTEFQNSTPNKPAIATVPEAATDTPACPHRKQPERPPMFPRRWVLKWTVRAIQNHRRTENEAQPSRMFLSLTAHCTAAHGGSLRPLPRMPPVDRELAPQPAQHLSDHPVT